MIHKGEKIGLWINNKLKEGFQGDKDLFIDDKFKCYPIMVKKEVGYPFIVYNRTSVEPIYTKDRFNNNGICQENISITIDIADNSYPRVIEKTIKVREILEGEYEDYIADILLESSSEGYSIDNEDIYFIQTLTYTISI